MHSNEDTSEAVLAEQTRFRVHFDVLPYAFAPVIVAALFASFALLLVYGLQGAPGAPVEKPVAFEKSEKTDSPPPPISELTYEEIFQFKLGVYQDKLVQFDANLKLQALFVLVTLLLILRRSDTLNVFRKCVGSPD